MSAIHTPTVPRRRFRFRRVLAAVGALLISAALCLGVISGCDAARLDHPLTAPTLTDAELEQAAAIRQAKLTLGDRIWPGFGTAPIPFVLFNDKYEFLLGAEAAPAGWEPVPHSLFAERPYFRRTAVNPQAFAAPVGNGWAGSMTTQTRMNRDIFLLMRKDLPLGLGKLIPNAMTEIDAPFFRSMVLHETFHAFQASTAPDRFANWRDFYRGQARYPYENAAFKEAWNQEGKLLSQALDEPELAQVQVLVRQFLAVRDQRRTAVNANADLLRFEREVEWLEGLAKYVEILTYEVAEGASLEALKKLGFWQTDFRRLDGALGEADSDLRFYLSGMAMARLLDRLDPAWKEHALAEGVYLETLLRAAVEH